MKASTMTVLAGLLCSSAALANQPVMMVQKTLDVDWEGVGGPFVGKSGSITLDVIADFDKCELYVLPYEKNIGTTTLTKPISKHKGLKVECNPVRIYIEYWDHDLILKEGQAAKVRWSAYRDSIYSTDIRYWADTGISEVRMTKKGS